MGLSSEELPCYASSVNGGDTPERATDGDLWTYWQAAGTLIINGIDHYIL
ncbi:hypothetical protein [Thermoanaerobacter pentosaceus]|uniref:Uncharacterized protein n=1 Tax=Thermoanaerobacter pentosaceus TaxID=694059 RepID=A0ABT9M259_9THEO|nr:hypothetical protein [Thermoanaerobacter pentosaceus]MDP9750155.1 hypothetical protein [Thermoanaerobacter pentosaceus]